MSRYYAGNNGNGQQDDRHHRGVVVQIGTKFGTEAATVTIRIYTKIIRIVICMVNTTAGMRITTTIPR